MSWLCLYIDVIVLDLTELVCLYIDVIVLDFNELVMLVR